MHRRCVSQRMRSEDNWERNAMAAANQEGGRDAPPVSSEGFPSSRQLVFAPAADGQQYGRFHVFGRAAGDA